MVLESRLGDKEKEVMTIAQKNELELREIKASTDKEVWGVMACVCLRMCCMVL